MSQTERVLSREILFNSKYDECEYLLTSLQTGKKETIIAGSLDRACEIINENKWLWLGVMRIKGRPVVVASSPGRLIINRPSSGPAVSPKRSPREGVLMENYLKTRETGAFFEQRAYYEILKRLRNCEKTVLLQRRAALREMRNLNSYVQTLMAIRWVEENGTFPDRHRCLCPILWLSKNPQKMRAILHRASAEVFRVRVEESRRHLISEHDLEKRRADRETQNAVRKFEREFPTAPERRRAMIRVFNLRREVFGSLTLDDPAARALCIALLVSQIEALEIVQDRICLAG